MKKLVVLSLILSILLCTAPAYALTHTETGASARIIVDRLATSLSPGAKAAPHHVFHCTIGRCSFWIHGLSDCWGVVQVREHPDSYSVWFTDLICEPS